MGALFERDRSVIVKHIRNICKTGELSQDPTHVQKMHKLLLVSMDPFATTKDPGHTCLDSIMLCTCYRRNDWMTVKSRHSYGVFPWNVLYYFQDEKEACDHS